MMEMNMKVIKNYFELSNDEMVACNEIIILTKNKIEQKLNIDGINVFI